MIRRRIIPLAVSGLLACGLLMALGDDQPDNARPGAQSDQQVVEGRAAPPGTVDEARARARLLYESFHATLQFVHDEYYRPDQRLALPASTLERVFGELDRSHKVQLRWLAINAQAMNVEHVPRDDFERAVVSTLVAGKSEFDRVEKGVFRYAGAITLTSSCLKCHLPGRSDNKDRAAALVISIPLRK